MGELARRHLQGWLWNDIELQDVDLQQRQFWIQDLGLLKLWGHDSWTMTRIRARSPSWCEREPGSETVRKSKMKHQVSRFVSNSIQNWQFSSSYCAGNPPTVLLNYMLGVYNLW